MAEVSQDTASDASTTVNLPRVTIKFCTQCKWMLRAAYVCFLHLRTPSMPSLVNSPLYSALSQLTAPLSFLSHITYIILDFLLASFLHVSYQTVTMQEPALMKPPPPLSLCCYTYVSNPTRNRIRYMRFIAALHILSREKLQPHTSILPGKYIKPDDQT